MPLWQQILNLQAKLADLRKEYFFEDILFGYHWWILVGQTLVLWAVWLILVDRGRLRNILLVGLFSLAFALVLDDMGLSTGAWNYPYKIVYFTTRLNPVDMVILPITFMLIYQYFQRWGSYLIATILFAAFASFIAEPLFVKLNLYTMIHWKYLYSAPIYTAIGIVVKGAADIVERIEQKARTKEGS
ncbi:MAG TPA: CBO0543 family protein [Bacillales bacterium]|nr:CBO0543 family protein [Bacillales bacterium]